MSRLDELLGKMSSGGSNRYLKLPNVGNKAVVRLFPPYDEEDEKEAEKKGGFLDSRTGILLFNQHKFLPLIGKEALGRNPAKGESYPTTNYACLKGRTKLVKKGGKKVRIQMKCPFCKFANTLSGSDRELSRTLGMEYRACIDLYNSSLGIPQRFFFSKRTAEKFSDLFNYFPDVNHPKRGRNIIIQRSQDNFNPYIIRAGKPSRLTLSEDEYPNIIEELDNLKVVTPEEAEEILSIKIGRKVRL